MLELGVLGVISRQRLPFLVNVTGCTPVSNRNLRWGRPAGVDRIPLLLSNSCERRNVGVEDEIYVHIARDRPSVGINPAMSGE